jgi:predicted permease
MTDGEGAILIAVMVLIAMVGYLIKRFDSFEREEWRRRNRP